MVTIIVLAIVALIVLPVVIGFLMPVRYEGTTAVEYDRSVQQVWDALQDVEAHPMTGKMMKTVETLPPDEGRPAWKEDMGRGEVIKVRTTAFEPLEPAGEGWRATLSGVTDIETGTWHTPIFRVMMVGGGGVKKDLDIQLDMVASTLGTEAHRP